MAEFRIDRIGELSRQLTFTPCETRLAQIDSAERLLSEIDSGKAYPLDFIIFRITGYRPKRVERDLLTGLALQHDLGLLIERISVTLDLRQETSSQPVLSIDEVGEQFSVTSKTIQRWRRRGLAARIFLFADGKRRVGFLLSTVERFLAIHRDQVAGTGNFSPVTEEEKSQILSAARRLAPRCSAAEIARRIGRRMNRSPLAITHTIKTHDRVCPRDAILAAAVLPIQSQEQEAIFGAYRGGEGISALAHRTQRGSAQIYRVIIEQRLAKLNRRRVRFIDDPLYHQEEAGDIVEQIAGAADIGVKQKAEELRIPRDLPAYLADLYRTPLFSPAKERAMFLKLNFHKFQFVTARRKIDPQSARARDLKLLEQLRRRVIACKNEIVRANLRLVVSVARKHLRPGVSLSLMELISEGNLTLMRAVDSFDFHKGNRFSTYATLALMKGFARSVPQMLYGERKTSEAARLATVADARPMAADRAMLDRDEVHQLLSRLDNRERDVLCAHYGLAEGAAATYEQVGSQMGLSKQRVRQIEQAALAKLRACGLR
jgi:RNA polymerase primary sigma factor